MTHSHTRLLPILATTALVSLSGMASAQDLIVDGSACIGFDCVVGESFGFDTLKLKENNLRIKADDTSNSASFPLNDWQITFNDTSNGGLNKFSIDDVTGGRTPFTIEAGARTNALYVDDGGRIGIGTGTPVVNLHVVTGNTPTLRLEQDGSSGFQAQVWDMAGNETNFFIRDASNGSTLPFRIRPDSLTSAIEIDETSVTINDDQRNIDFRVESDTNQNAIFVDATLDFVGIGTGTPEQKFHIQTSAVDTDAFALFDADGAGSDAAFLLRQNGTVATTWEFRNQESSGRLNIGVEGGNTVLKIDSTAANNLLKLGTNSNPSAVVVTGQLLVNNTQMNVPDYVFADDYTLRPLADVRAFIDANSHLPEVPSEADIMANGLNMTDMQMALLKKVEELTLYTLEQDQLIADQAARLAQIETLLVD